MKIQNLAKIVHQNYIGSMIVSMLDFKSLNEIQKSVSTSMFSLNRLNSPNFVFSIEDVFHSISNREFLKKDIFDSTEFLAAHSIPFKVQYN
jgi:hypothetical protein